MTETMLRAVVIGLGATAVIDIWALGLRRLGVASLQMALLGRWLGHLLRGRWAHDSIAAATPMRGERLIGWFAHYAIGVTFAVLLLSLVGLTWARAPSLWPPLIVGLATVVAPLFVLQPAIGAGVASAKTPRPLFNALKSVATHAVFGVGMYVAAWATNAALPGAWS